MKRHWKYFLYVIRHKWFVFWAGVAMGINPLWLLVHDWDKFLPGMWLAYAKTFYAPDGTNQYKPENGMDQAWNRHQKLNKHHWQYWMLTWDTGKTECLPMSKRHIKEMIADWKGAGRALNSEDPVQVWYLRNREKIQLHKDSRDYLEALLGVQFTDRQRDVAMFGAEVEQVTLNTDTDALIWVWQFTEREKLNRDKLSGVL